MVPFDTPNETTAENEARFRAQVQSELQRQQREIEDLRLGLAAVVRRLDEGGVP